MDNSSLFKRLLPHIAAVGIFALITLTFHIDAFRGKQIYQHDLAQVKGMAKELRDYYDETGENALWTNSMFSGMPGYFIYVKWNSNLLSYAFPVLSLGMPNPAKYTFLSLLGFYLLLVAIRLNPWLSIAGAIGYAFCSYYFIILGVGHSSKAHAMAYMGPMLAGIILLFRGKYLLGAILSMFSLALLLVANHLQITYYTLMLGGLYVLIELVNLIIKQRIKVFFKALAFLLIAAILAIGANASKLIITDEYAPETIRGGQSELAAKQKETKGGLDKEYATRWSYGIGETFTILIPNFKGGGSQSPLPKNSNYYKALVKNQMPPAQAARMNQKAPTYWGEQMNTSGPVYFGAIICFFFIIGCILVKGTLRIWLILATLLSIFLCWGKHSFIFDLFFDYFPMYNKFRAPSMNLIMTQVTMSLLATLGINALIKEENKDLKMLSIYIAAGVTGGFCLLMLVLGGAFFDFSGRVDTEYDLPGWMINALVDDRAALFRWDALRSLIFIVLAAGGALLLVYKSISKELVFGLLALLIVIDMWGVGKRYLNSDNYITKSQYEKQYKPSQVDLQILQDKDPNYRVLNTTTSTFNDAMTSYFHKSVGGYHAAKLIRYQDLIERHIGRNNMSVLNMLNTRYVIGKDQQERVRVQRNPGALGNAWFVQEIDWVENADEEIDALGDFDPKKTVVIDKRYKKDLEAKSFTFDPAARIQLDQYKPNHLTYSYNAASDQMAVFSEIYYNSGLGWQAYLDGKPVEHERGNYVLRVMHLPAGQHKVEYKFEPQSYTVGSTISLVFSSLLLILCFGGLYMDWSGKNNFDDEQEKTPEPET